MSTYLLLYIPPAIAVALTGYVFIRIQRRIAARKNLYPFPNSAVALVEKDLQQLQTVHVICHHIEQPDAFFRTAVIDNLKEGVKYIFYIPEDEYSKEIADGSFVTYFNSCINIAKTETKESNGRFNNLISIKKLPCTWDDYPYIYYEYKDCGKEGDYDKLIAFRGTKKCVGIAPSYEPIGRETSETIASIVGLEISKSAKFAYRIEAKEVVYDMQQNSAPIVISEPAERDQTIQ